MYSDAGTEVQVGLFVKLNRECELVITATSAT